MKPTLSIVTITYNDSPGLSKTLNSLKPLAGDKILKWEHIVVDSSPEVNSPILNQLVSWPLIRIETPPRGIYPAFNLGIEHAQGEYIWFLNSGDCLLSIKNLKELLNQFGEESSFELMASPVEIYRENKFTYMSKVKGSFISNLIGQNSLCHQGMIYRRSVFERVGKFDESFKLAGDYDHYFKCYFNGVGFGTFLHPIAQYDRGGRSDNFNKVFNEFKKIRKNYRLRLSPQLRIKNDFLAMGHFLKLSLIKSKLLKPISKPLKSIWYRLH